MLRRNLDLIVYAVLLAACVVAGVLAVSQNIDVPV